MPPVDNGIQELASTPVEDLTFSCIHVLLSAVIVPPPDNLVIAKLRNCQQGQGNVATAAAAEVAVQSAAAADVAVASSGLSYVRDLAPDCWVLLRANTAGTAEAAVSALAASGEQHTGC